MSEEKTKSTEPMSSEKFKDKVFVNSKEAAVILQLTPNGLSTRRRRKLPPSYYKVGGKLLYDLEELQQFVLSGHIVPGEETKDHD